jgi:hypothetical protein
MFSCESGAREASGMTVKCAYNQFRELSPILIARGASVQLKGTIYSVSGVQ